MNIAIVTHLALQTVESLGGINAQAIASVAAALVPVLASLAKDNDKRAGVAFLLAVAIAVVQVVATGDLSPGSLIVAAVYAVVTEVSAYHVVWKPMVHINDRVGGASGAQ